MKLEDFLDAHDASILRAPTSARELAGKLREMLEPAERGDVRDFGLNLVIHELASNPRQDQMGNIRGGRLCLYQATRVVYCTYEPADELVLIREYKNRLGPPRNTLRDDEIDHDRLVTVHVDLRDARTPVQVSTVQYYGSEGEKWAKLIARILRQHKYIIDVGINRVFVNFTGEED